MLVDTSVWIDFFNGHESKQVERLACAIGESEPIAIPGVVLTEILLGLKHDAEAENISYLLNAFDAVAEPTREPKGRKHGNRLGIWRRQH